MISLVDEEITQAIFEKFWNAYSSKGVGNTKKLNKLRNHVKDMASKFNYTKFTISEKTLKDRLEFYTDNVIERIKINRLIDVTDKEEISWNEEAVHKITGQ